MAWTKHTPLIDHQTERDVIGTGDLGTHKTEHLVLIGDLRDEIGKQITIGFLGHKFA